MKVLLSSDHAGRVLRLALASVLRDSGRTFEDLGPTATTSVDYPDFARPVCERVVVEPGTVGVLVCGTGIGMSISANKFHGIRAALASTEFEARMGRMHNDANVLCLGERVVGVGVATAILETFLSTNFEGGRHLGRVHKITALEAEQGRK